MNDLKKLQVTIQTNLELAWILQQVNDKKENKNRALSAHSQKRPESHKTELANQTQTYIKKIMHCIQVGFIPEVQDGSTYASQ